MTNFSFKETKLAGAYVITPLYSEDKRGGLIKDYNIEIFRKNGINHQLKEVFYTVSKKGVIRAIHFQNVKQQAKLVRCIKGKIYDVIVDLRKETSTYKKWQAFELTEENRKCLYVPRYFGHGYLVIEDAIVGYQCDEVFYPEYDSGIRWNDEIIDVDWPLERVGGIENIIVSEKDQNLPDFLTFERKNI